MRLIKVSIQVRVPGCVEVIRVIDSEIEVTDFTTEDEIQKVVSAWANEFIGIYWEEVRHGHPFTRKHPPHVGQ